MKKIRRSGSLLCFAILLSFCFQSFPGFSQVDPDIKKVLSTFPVGTIDELVQSVTPDEYDLLLKTGSSAYWEILAPKNTRKIVYIQNKRASDNNISFYKYKMNSDKWLFGVQQNNAQNQKTDLWLYSLQKKGWELFPTPPFMISEFVSELVILPREINVRARSLLNVEFGDSVYFRINELLLIKEVLRYFPYAGSSLEHNYLKYKYALSSNLIFTKLQESDFEPLPVITAKIEHENPDGPGLDEFNCQQGVSVTASSALPVQSTQSYSARNVLDKNNKTAWSEGVKGSGQGEWIEFTITGSFYIGNSYQLTNGYTKDKNSWANNNRIKKLKCLVNGKPVAIIILNDVMNRQYFYINHEWFEHRIEFKKGDKIRFIIEEVYKGLKYDDTLLSHFVPTGNCG